MGFFSGIIDSVKDSMSYIADTTVNIFGGVTDMFKPDKEPMHVTSYETADFWYDDMYDDYADWIQTFGS